MRTIKFQIPSLPLVLTWKHTQKKKKKKKKKKKREREREREKYVILTN